MTEVEKNIVAGQEALSRAADTIVRPGVKLDIPDGVPVFHADPDRPDLIIRVLNGKREHGLFENGEFVNRLT